jgi:predicted nucleic acid-binding protein
VSLVLDASMALSWLIQRADPDEQRLSRQAFEATEASGAVAPGLWFTEVGNTLLVFERARRFTQLDSERFLADLDCLRIDPDSQPPFPLQRRVLDLGRRYGLTAYDAVYLELTERTGLPLATFDRQLAEAVRRAGGRVFGDGERAGS